MSRTTPITDSCANTGHYTDPRYTSPCRYVDLTEGDVDQNTAKCPECGRSLKLSVNQIPSYICELADTNDEEARTISELRSALFLVHQEIINRPEAG